MLFPISGVEVFPLWPPLVALVVSFFTSMAGVSGAFLLLPFQVSVLHFTSPAVSPTNLVFNIVAIPSGVYRYIREGRMTWPLCWLTILGTLPGVFLGALARIVYLPDPKAFKFFVGLVLAYIGLRLIFDSVRQKAENKASNKSSAEEIARRLSALRQAGGRESAVKTIEFSFRRVSYQFLGQIFQASAPAIFLMALGVGLVGGAYGIGGGAIIAPFFVSVFGLPVHTVAGAALMGTFVTSIAGVAFYSLIAPHFAHLGLAVAPDWLLGALFGLGGLVGMYFGARAQKHLPARAIKLILAGLLIFVSGGYIWQFFA